MDKKGVLYALIAYLMWGLFPLYWKQLETIPALAIDWPSDWLVIYLAPACNPGHAAVVGVPKSCFQI